MAQCKQDAAHAIRELHSGQPLRDRSYAGTSEGEWKDVRRVI